ncbi:MAG: sigma-70 family RNA polymerase sigma factor, partial [Planctomycetota bacterium]|nr:sigma-70 family RNA polymerase sigma factor [Planctomycetota bacterium]
MPKPCISRTVESETTAIASGDPEAFARFYDAWFDRAFAEARHCTHRDDEFCLDVVQDAMLKVIKSMKPLPNEAALNRWIRVVIRSCAYDRLRADISRKRRENDASSSFESKESSRPPQEQLAWLHEQLELL